VPELRAFEFEMSIEKLKGHKSPDVDQVPGESIKAEVEQFAMRSTSINLLILSGIRKKCLRSGRSRSFYLSVRRTIKQTVVIIEAYHFFNLRTKFYSYHYLNLF
jgi:hypothetical protein